MYSSPSLQKYILAFHLFFKVYIFFKAKQDSFKPQLLPQIALAFL